MSRHRIGSRNRSTNDEPVAGGQVRLQRVRRRRASAAARTRRGTPARPGGAASGESVSVDSSTRHRRHAQHREGHVAHRQDVRHAICARRQADVPETLTIAGEIGCDAEQQPPDHVARPPPPTARPAARTRSSPPAWPPAAGSARPAGSAGSAACPPAPRRRSRRRRRPRPRPAGTAAARSPAPPAGTASRWSAPPRGTPAPGRAAAPMPVTATSTATSVGSAFSSRIVTQVRGRGAPACTSSTADHRLPSRRWCRARSRRPRARPPPATAARAPSSCTRTPRATSLALRSAGSVARTTSRSPSRASTPPSSSADDGRGVGGAHDRPAGGRLQRRPAPPAAPAGRGRARRRGCTSARPRPAGGWTGRSSCRVRAAPRSSSRISRMPCGSRPLVGSSSTSSRGWRSSAPARPSRWRIPSEYALTGRLPTPTEADLLQRLVDPRRPAAAPPVPGPLASSSRRLVRPLRCPYAAGPSTSAPTDGSTSRPSRGIGRPSSSIVARRSPAPARAASARSWSSRSRWRRGSRRCHRARTSRSTRSTAVSAPNRLVSPHVRIIRPHPRYGAARSPPRSGSPG